MRQYAFSMLACRLHALALATALNAACSFGLLAAPVVSQKSLERNCLDAGTGDHPLAGAAFEACLRKQIENLPPLNPSKREFFGEKYDPEMYVKCRLRPGNRNNSACNIYILRRREWPEYWPGKATRLRWPVSTPRVFKSGMTSKQYWDALCKADAGEFVLSPVRNVKGFLLVRPRGQETDIASADARVIEDAYGFLEFQLAEPAIRPGKLFLRLSPTTYRYVESGAEKNGLLTWLRHEIDEATYQSLLKVRPDKWNESLFTHIEEVPEPASQYAVIWRGIRREQDSELGISGGELAVFDLGTGQVLGYRRGYALDGFAARNVGMRHSWRGSWGCPTMVRNSGSLRQFIEKVLLPPTGIGGSK